MAILSRYHFNFIKLKYVILALICKNGVIRNGEVIRLLDIAPNLLRDKYTKPLENEGFIKSNKIGSKKLWGPTPKGQGAFDEM